MKTLYLSDIVDQFNKTIKREGLDDLIKRIIDKSVG